MHGDGNRVWSRRRQPLRSVLGGRVSRNNVGGMGRKNDGRAVMPTNVNVQDACPPLTANRARPSKNQGPEEKGDKREREREVKTKRNFLQVDCFHTRHSYLFSFFWCQSATPSLRGEQYGSLFLQEKCRLLYMLYSIIQKHAAMARPKLAEASPPHNAHNV